MSSLYQKPAIYLLIQKPKAQKQTEKAKRRGHTHHKTTSECRGTILSYTNEFRISTTTKNLESPTLNPAKPLVLCPHSLKTKDISLPALETKGSLNLDRPPTSHKTCTSKTQIHIYTHNACSTKENNGATIEVARALPWS